MSLLEAQELQVRYGRVTAVRSASFGVERGEALAVLGRNGAGKSSLMHAIAGSVRPAGGRILWRGEEITRLSADRRVGAGITLVPEGRRIFGELSVLENLRLGGFRLEKHTFQGRLEHVFGLFPILKERAESAAGRLSGGQQQMLAIGRALMADPELLLLDEPSLGLAPLVVDEIYQQFSTLREQGITLILVEQHVQRALGFADRALVLNLGEVVLNEHPDVLARDPRLVRAYLGGMAEVEI